MSVERSKNLLEQEKESYQQKYVDKYLRTKKQLEEIKQDGNTE